MEFRYFQDPSHGWLEVSADIYLEIVNRSGWKATNCSYYSKSRSTVYLEEDLDMHAFLDRIENFDRKIIYQEKTFIRDLPSIRELHERNGISVTST